MFQVDNSTINGLALAIVALFVTMLVFSLVPVLILNGIGISKKITDKFIGFFCLIGFAVWIYLMFYLNFYEFFI